MNIIIRDLYSQNLLISILEVISKGVGRNRYRFTGNKREACKEADSTRKELQFIQQSRLKKKKQFTIQTAIPENSTSKE